MTSEGGPRTVHLLWSGGWDSTFRLLTALLVEGVTVRPHHVLDPSSPAACHQVEAMQAVRGALERLVPSAAERLLPTAAVSLDDLPEHDEVERRLARLNLSAPAARRFEALVRYARHAGLEWVEVGCHRGGPLTRLLEGHVRPVRDRPFAAYRLGEPARDGELGVLARFTFATPDLTRAEMCRLALEGGYLEALDATWFCPTPRQGEPCGVCEKCRAVVAEGFGHRLPACRGRLHAVSWLAPRRPWRGAVAGTA